jgi:virginiamycin B lyase
MLLLGCAVPAVAQTITLYAVPGANGGLNGITTGSDGALWATDCGSNNIFRITTAGAVTAYPIPTANSCSDGITAGPDGALWFAEQTAGNIGRITTAGVFTEYPTPTANSDPSDITVGPDGALWFTEEFAGNIGRITTAGVFTEYPVVPTASSDPVGITTGPDGALWFTESGNSNKIGRITTAGTVTAQYPIPGYNDAYNDPVAITAGPDGALWFPEVGASAIGRITTAGVFSDYPTPIPGVAPFFGITVGPDGALWFTETEGCEIGRITTAGILSGYALPYSGRCVPPPNTTGITTGPDGALWFLLQNTNQIGRLLPPTTTLFVTETGTGTGRVTSSPAGIDCSARSNQCSAEFNTGSEVTLTASAGAGSVFAGWSGGGCSGTSRCHVTVTAGPTVTANFTAPPSYVLSVALAGTGTGSVTSSPAGINCSASSNQCAAPFSGEPRVVTLMASASAGSTFAGWSGGGCVGIDPCTLMLNADTTVTASFVQNTTTNIALAAAVLPLSRSVEVGATATAFATLIDAGRGDASTCSIAPATSIPASFAFQTTDPTTNALTGTANTPVNISQGASQSFVIALAPSAAFSPTNVLLTFACANASPAPVIVGIDTLNLSASSSPVPDIVALAASADPGYVDIPGATGTGDFAVATVNLGSAAQITASANTGTANLPVMLLVCQTDPTTGNCFATPQVNVTTTIAANATPTFGIFVAGSAAVPDSPGANRVFVTFTDAGGMLRGETSVAVRTQ